MSSESACKGEADREQRSRQVVDRVERADCNAQVVAVPGLDRRQRIAALDRPSTVSTQAEQPFAPARVRASRSASAESNRRCTSDEPLEHVLERALVQEQLRAAPGRPVAAASRAACWSNRSAAIGGACAAANRAATRRAWGQSTSSAPALKLAARFRSAAALRRLRLDRRRRSQFLPRLLDRGRVPR